MQEQNDNEPKFTLIPSLLSPKYHKYINEPLDYILEQAPESPNWSPKTLLNLLTGIALSYKTEHQNVHYHNLTHAFDVMTTMDQIMAMAEIGVRLEVSEEDRIVYLVAAFGHDCGHQGFTNQYYILGDRELAIRYLYTSPLQHMHASILLRLISQNEIKISLAMKKRLAAMILATDNAFHIHKIHQLAQLSSQQDLKPHSQLILSSILHASDLSNPTKQFPIFNAWSARIQAEFQHEKSLLAGTKGNQITLIDKLRMQKQFAQHFVRPFYLQLRACLPGISGMVERIDCNIQKLDVRMKKERQKEREREEQ